MHVNGDCLSDDKCCSYNWTGHLEITPYDLCNSVCVTNCQSLYQTQNFHCFKKLPDTGKCYCCTGEIHKLTYKGLYFRNLIK